MMLVLTVLPGPVLPGNPPTFVLAGRCQLEVFPQNLPFDLCTCNRSYNMTDNKLTQYVLHV